MRKQRNEKIRGLRPFSNANSIAMIALCQDMKLWRGRRVRRSTSALFHDSTFFERVG